MPNSGQFPEQPEWHCAGITSAWPGRASLELSSLLKKASCLSQNTKSKKRGFYFSHNTKGLGAFGIAETSMFRYRLLKSSGFQQPVRTLFSMS
jgi:hypothetical protein